MGCAWEFSCATRRQRANKDVTLPETEACIRTSAQPDTPRQQGLRPGEVPQLRVPELLIRQHALPQRVGLGPGVGRAAGALTKQAQGLGKSEALTFAFAPIVAGGAVVADVCTAQHMVVHNPSRL